MSEVTQLLNAIGQGDPDARSRLLPLIYDELRRIARGHMAHERVEHTLQATALVHEAYFRLLGNDDAQWDGRGHFFAAAAEAMRRILIDHARKKKAIKHGGGQQRVDLLDEIPAISSPSDKIVDLLALNDALDRLAAEAPDEATLVKLLYFVGLNLDDAARALGMSRTSAYRKWCFARAWLRDAMLGGSAATLGE